MCWVLVFHAGPEEHSVKQLPTQHGTACTVWFSTFVSRLNALMKSLTQYLVLALLALAWLWDILLDSADLEGWV